MRVQGFGTTEEMVRLCELAEGHVVLELGAYKGASAVLMAKAGAKVVHSVDWHQGDADIGPGDSLCEMWHHLERAGVRDRVVLHVGRFQDVLPFFRPDSFDMAFVDGCHDERAVTRDLQLAVPLLRPGSVVACHDYGLWGVEAAVKVARRSWGEGEMELIDTLAVWRLAS